jgi:NAD(P)-dependent dehydrogenase (short-subunit alcohol dehydrogenase family)
VTTRFPKDALLRFAAESDFALWRERVHVYALDLRLLPALEQFCEHVLSAYPRLDIIINNAAQTIRRPPVFYSSLLQVERSALPQNLVPLLGSWNPQSALSESSTTSSSSEDAITPIFGELSALQMSPAALSQVKLIAEDNVREEERDSLFPAGAYDRDGQQVDLRTQNSWTKQANDVTTVELAEVHVVNALAPFILATKLRPLMLKARAPTYIVNVSSMEGKFSRTKKTTHPHTY